MGSARASMGRLQRSTAGSMEITTESVEIGAEIGMERRPAARASSGHSFSPFELLGSALAPFGPSAQSTVAQRTLT